ncbi:protein kinase [Thalassolituus sp.]|uniref:protein kinase domain-containing protein n=1 Tax=Thalassolituus sp. TaxID=2030822 RepID=UPI0035170129
MALNDSNTSLEITFGGYSTAGNKPENQDAFAAWQPSASSARYKGIACCIADGVSCSENAQQASVTSVTHFLNDYYSTPDSWDVKTAAGKVLSSLNSWLYHHGQQASARHNSLVTTFSSIVLKSSTLHAFHAGDSRIYRLRGTSLECLTRDHTHQYGQGKEYLSRALGMDTHLEVDYLCQPLEEGDILLLTTDGVHGVLPDKRLRDVLLENISEDRNQTLFEKCARSLVDAALETGSDDNLTAVIVRVESLPEQNIDEAHRVLTERVIPPVLNVGDCIDHFEVEQILYSGTRSHLYRVLNRRDKKRYVLKAPSLNFEEDLVYLEGFVREQWAGARIDHPNVMKIMPPEAHGRFMYHICELVEGESLRQWINDHPMADLSEVRVIIEQIVLGLRAFQRMGMIHRDLKPENVMITAQGQVKLIDFGTVLVKGLSEVASPIDEDCPVGSVNYIAPEYVIDGVATMQSDLFSLGVMVYEMLSGAQPFKMEKVHRSGAKSTSQWKYHPLREHRSDIPLWLDLAIEKACHPDIHLRHGAYSEFWSDLTKPNPALIGAHAHKPLMARHPEKVWPVVSGVLLVIVIIQSWLLLSQ